MALKSVVSDGFFDDVIGALRLLEEERGQLAFALLTTSPLYPLKWDLTLAADWIDRTSLLRAGSTVRSFLEPRLLTPAKLGFIKIRRTQDLLVRSLTATVTIAELGRAYWITGQELSDFSIEEAVCLVSRPNRASALTMKVPA